MAVRFFAVLVSFPPSISASKLRVSIEPSSKPDSASETTSFVEVADCLLDELTRHSNQGPSLQRFYEDLLERLAILPGLSRASLWLTNDQENWTLSIQTGEQGIEKGSIEQATLSLIANEDAPRILDHGNNQTIVVPILANVEFPKVLCCEFGMGMDPKLAQIFRDFLNAIAEIANSFEQKHLIRNQVRKPQKLESFVQILFNATKTLELNEFAIQITNDCRSFVDAGRVWIFSTDPGIKLLACSGVSEINKRSRTAEMLTQIAKKAVDANREVSLHRSGKNCDPLILNHLDASGCQSMHVLLIKEQAVTTGVLVTEFFEDCDRISKLESLKQLLKGIQPSFNNARYSSNMPLRRVSRALHQLGKISGLQSVSKFWIAILTLAVLFSSTFFVSTDFEIAVEGQARPAFERRIFAPEDGTVQQLHVAYGDNVDSGQALGALVSKELELRLNELQSDLSSATKKLRATRLLRAEAIQQRKESVYIDQLSAELEQTSLSVDSFNRKINWLLKRIDALKITSPITGQVITRDVELRLLRRPVNRGDLLLSIAKTDADWRIVFEIPENDFGYLQDSKSANQISGWKVKYRFLSDLDASYDAVMDSFDQNNSFDTNGKSWVQGFVPIDRNVCPQLRVGQTVTGKVHCGKRSLFFVWTRDVRDYLRKNFFWM